MSKLRTYTREEYLDWCKEHGVKNPLEENRRNKLTISGYPVVSPIEYVDDDIDADDWYKTYGW